MDDDFKDREPTDLLHPDMDTESAFRLLLSQCCAEVDLQIAQFLERDDPAGAHKARVALRRLTTTLDAFAGILKRKAHASERARAKAIFREIGKVREADVYLGLRGPDAPAKARDKARGLRDAVRRKLRKDRVVGFSPALMGKAADGTLFRAKARGLSARARPLHGTAAAALEASRAECLSFAESLSDMSELRRHELRKALKGLRYAGEFFAPVWASSEWPRVRSHLRDIQDALGDANDIALARERDGVTDRQAEAEALSRAQTAWSALRAAPRWWDETAHSA